MKFISDLKDFVYSSDNTVTQLMNSTVQNSSGKGKKILWLLLGGLFLLGSSYFGYRFGSGLVRDN